MKKNTLYVIILSFCISCAALKSNKNDPFVGKYKMTVLNVDQVGDIPAVLIISKDKKLYISDVNYKINGEERSLDIISTYSVDSSTLIVESLIDGSQIDFELNFENKGFTGTAGGYYDIEGKNIE
tara:strand:+ start:65 stop:439 length:375 start_codon:yes stop_codon:yes gene_type:complete